MIQLRVTLPAFPALILLALYATGLAAQESPKLPAANPASSSLAQQVRIKTQQHQGSASSAKAPSAAAKPIATAPSPAANAKAAPEAKAADAAAKPSPAAKPVPASDGASDQPGKAARTPAIKPAKATIRKLAKSPAPAQAQTATQTRLKTKDGTAAAPVTTATEKPPATAAAKQDADKTAATAVGKATASPEAMQQQATEKNAPPAHRQQPAKAAGKEAPALKKLAQPAQPAPGTPPATVEPPIAAVPSPAQTQTPAQTAASPNTAAKSAKAAQPAPAATKPPTAASTPTAAAAASAVSAVPPQPLPGTLTIVSWGGGYGAAQSQTIIEPFARQTDIKVRQIRHGGAGRELDSRADVVDLDSSALAAACNAGKLLDLDDLTLAPPPSRASVKRDLIDGARSRCGIGSLAWSHVVLVRGQAFKKRRPSTLQHVFDARRYPGKRAFVKNPRYLLEMALMADGVAPAEVYATLDSEEGLSRALAKLSTLRKHIIWVEKVSDAYRLLQSGKAVMAAGFSGRAFRMSRLDPRLRTIWDGQIYDVEYWAIPRSAKNIAAARRFVAYATAPKRLARNARYFPYGPMRKSAVRMARKHAVLNIDLRPYLPTSRRNLRRALRFNASWWALKEPLLKPRFDAWLKELATPRSRRKRQAG